MAMLSLVTLFLLAASMCAPALAHMLKRPAQRHESMYGVGPGFTSVAGDPFSPIGPDIAKQDNWWFRGPGYRALKPQNDSVMSLPVGGTVELEIACNAAWTSYGDRTTDPDAELSACPENYGAYHSGDPTGPVDQSLLSGCALAVADKDDIEQVGWDDLVVFSVNHECVKQRVTQFERREVHLRLACKQRNSAYNEPTNVVWQGNDNRPGYHASWSFPKNGAQDDIFDTSHASSALDSTGGTSTGLSALPDTFVHLKGG
ncbi:hypothetical protein BMF94_3901 [Rhodotorula taiwanensis]|uniref:Uncharacterized protein n=1 Tax=Rhodotorula taiwanensis TaxID=741276 RepID=A0A2S5B8G2_9BASI|nr:hypothetical protein BMF94_3901 [Rhodotorula taiwanensis]